MGSKLACVLRVLIVNVVSVFCEGVHEFGFVRICHMVVIHIGASEF